MLGHYLKYARGALHSLNNSKLLAGVVMLMMNVGGKYIDIKLSKTQETFIRNTFVRELFIFAVAWMGTHDIVLSILLTAAFMILANYLFNEKSSLCIMSAKYKNLDKILDTNEDGIISPEEIAKARQTLQKAQRQENRTRQVDALNYMHSNS